MAAIKSYTDLPQSKKLAKILPFESADMHYSKDFDGSWFIDLAAYTSVKIPKYVDKVEEHLLPCWSLAALLEQIPSDLGSSTLTIEKCDSEPFKYGLNYHDRWGREDDIQTKYYDDLVDACVDMIIKLYEQKFL